jgi:hypothetical protein
MLCREIIAVCSQIRTKHTNTRCGQNVEFVSVKLALTNSSHKALMGYGNKHPRFTQLFEQSTS